ncbi:MAG TPA: tetratricopeptide repeat protein, partial [Pyrinomonadaceae bacterium]|nr:tetratricopeptide repeat protein [Pyrinomonadaceae bacterium]
IYQRQGKLTEAEAVLVELLDLEKNDLQARTELARIYQRQGKLKEAEERLLESLEIDDKQLHPRTELAKIYQRQGKLEEAEARLDESLAINPLDDYALAELLAIWERQGEKEKIVDRFFQFTSQPGFQFSRYFQASVFRFFRCCDHFSLRDDAKTVFDRFQAELDEQNMKYYRQHFGK